MLGSKALICPIFFSISFKQYPLIFRVASSLATINLFFLVIYDTKMMSCITSLSLVNPNSSTASTTIIVAYICFLSLFLLTLSLLFFFLASLLPLPSSFFPSFLLFHVFLFLCFRHRNKPLKQIPKKRNMTSGPKEIAI